MEPKLAWGIIGTGGIARAFAEGVRRSRTGTLAAVGSRTRESAERFAREAHVPHALGTYEALLEDPSVQAVYIATPHPIHAEWAIRAAGAGKHVLVEKPIGLNHAEAMRMVEAAVANDVFLMEAFMYRCHPQTRRLVELIREKVVGDVRVIHATFSFHWPRARRRRCWRGAARPRASSRPTRRRLHEMPSAAGTAKTTSAGSNA